MDTHQIVTPENVELNYEIAGIGSRFLALLIDNLIQGFTFFAIVLAAIVFEVEKTLQTIPGVTRGIITSALIVMAVIITFGYHIILETMMNGQTIGKMILHIRVRKEQGNRLTFWDVLLRNFIRFIDMSPFYITGLIVMFMNKKAKRLGDLAAGTIVIREIPRKQLEQFLTVKVPEPMAYQESFTVKNSWIQSVLTSITQKDYFLMKNIYSRRSELSNFNDLAAGIIQKLIAKSSLPERPAFYPSEAEEILAEMIGLYEKTYS